MKVQKITPLKAKKQTGKMSCTFAEKKLKEAIRKLNIEMGLPPDYGCKYN